MSTIRVVNQKHIRNRRPDGTAIYIGRPSAEYAYVRSPLANEWSHLQNSRARHHVESIEEAVRCYHRWLLEEVKDEGSAAFRELERLAEIAERGTLLLVCWCVNPAGVGECHGHVVKRAVEWRMRERRKRAAEPPPAEPSPDESGGTGGEPDIATLVVAAASARPAPRAHISC